MGGAKRESQTTTISVMFKDSAQHETSAPGEGENGAAGVSRAKLRATVRKRAAKELPDAGSNSEAEHSTKRTKPMSARARATKELESTDSDDGDSEERPLTSTSTSTNNTPRKRSADETHTQTNKYKRYKEKESQENP